MAGGHIRSEGDVNSCVQELTDRRHAGREVAVRHRAMDYIHAVPAHQFHLLAVRIAAMRHERRRLSEQTVLIIRIAVTGRVRLQFLHPIDFRAVLGEMRLHGNTGLGGIIAQSTEHLIGARRHKTRRDDRFHQTVAVFVQVRFEHLHAFHQFGSRVLQGLGAVSIHAHQAHICTHTRLNEEIREDASGLRMNSSKDRGTHRTLHPQLMHKTAV